MNNVSQVAKKDREFELTIEEFKKLTGLIRGLTGIVLGDHKMEMLYGRLARRLRELGFKTFSQYCQLLDSDKAESEIGFLVNAITTNLTKFYRESHHFDSLAEHLHSIQHDRSRVTEKTVRIWSAGCSSGEEPYSIASVLLNKAASLAKWDVKILATDLDTNMLNKGSTGIYPTSSLEKIPDDYQKVFDTITVKKDDQYHIKDIAKKMVHFKQLNLLHKWPMRRKYDVIFCRNVLIYFDAPTKDDLVKRYTDMLAPGGMLFLGHSETLVNKIPALNLIGRTSYRKEV